ncbi:MAG: S8 family serine peptidase [Planctomycetota bacterium]
MKCSPRLLSLLFVPLLLAPPAAAQDDVAVDPEALSRVPYDQHMVVRLLPGHSIQPISDAIGGKVVVSDKRRGLHLVKTPQLLSQGEFDALCFAVKGLPMVVYAEPDVPTDPPEIGDCGPDGDTVGAQQCTIAFIDGTPSVGEFDDQAAMEQIVGPDAHSAASGVPLVVAVIDTGVDLAHSHFAGHIAPGGWDYLTGTAGGADFADGVDDDGDGVVDEGLGHGTHVGGLVLLSDPNAMILPMRALDNDGNGSAFLVALAIFDAVDAGATVINMSLSMRIVDDVIAEALMYAEYHGVLVVSSAGNANEEVLFPANFELGDFTHLQPDWMPAGTVLTGDNVVAVSGVDEYDVKASFACFGAKVDISTPAVNVYSAQMNAAMAWWSGTSMSSGIAAGSLSFLLSIWGQGDYDGTPLELLQETADDLDALNPAFAGELGTGRINLKAATDELLNL